MFQIVFAEKMWSLMASFNLLYAVKMNKSSLMTGFKPGPSYLGSYLLAVQCDKISRNFAALAKVFIMQLGKFSLL